MIHRNKNNKYYLKIYISKFIDLYMRLKEFEKRLQEKANPSKAKIYQRFFKTGKGEYGEGDVFLGLTMGDNRDFAKEFRDLSLENIQKLLDSKIHEKRMIGLLILVDRFKKASKAGNEKVRKEIFRFYLSNTKNINNWDLVDVTTPHIVGDYLIDKSKSREILYELARSDSLWERRISVLATFSFIRQNEFEDALRINEILLGDKHDLMHKAVGWMLREVGKKDLSVLKEFLRENYNSLPRTTLRYAIERFEEGERKRWLRGDF